jgi:hypothetical protein
VGKKSSTTLPIRHDKEALRKTLGRPSSILECMYIYLLITYMDRKKSIFVEGTDYFKRYLSMTIKATYVPM